MLYISVTCLSYNWRLFNLLIPFAYLATAPLPSFLYLWVCFYLLLFVCLIKILYFTCKWDYAIFVFSVYFIGKNPVTTFRDTVGYDFNVWTEGTQLSPLHSPAVNSVLSSSLPYFLSSHPPHLSWTDNLCKTPFSLMGNFVTWSMLWHSAQTSLIIHVNSPNCLSDNAPC